MPLLGIEVLFDGINFQRIVGGLWITVRIALVSVAFSLLFGTLVGIVRCSRNIFITVPCKIYLEAVRIIPIIVWLFVFYYGLAQAFNVQWGAELTSVIVFTIWGTAEMSDLVRTAVTTLPIHQKQSAAALGLTNAQIYIYVIIPQALRRLIPSAINLTTRMIKTTPLVALITVAEALKIGQQVIEQAVFTNPSAPFWVYGFIFFAYFIICYPISIVSRKLENRWRQ
ncbi:amino acid ABC transporter permease [Campylobacterota bacterium]|nr:amino acid ABC transporter permease [Campylobacterota bacterium]GHV08184.1 amino acid ABC transporter permease [Campylobacterota bacterium]